MRKLKLEIESLEVQSFVAGSGEPRRGTVHGANRTGALNKIPAGDPNDTLYDGCTGGYSFGNTEPCDFTPYCVPSVNIPDTCVAPCG